MEHSQGGGAPAAAACYAAVIENRAKEVGVAVLHLSSLTLRISQHIEAGRSYTTTQLLLESCGPQQVVIVGSQHHEVSGGVNHAIAAAWDHSLLPRSAFDDTKGILAVQDATGWSPVDGGQGPSTAHAQGGFGGGGGGGGRALLKSHYLGFGAAGALLTHVRAHLRLVLTPRAVRVEFTGAQHHMALGRDAVTSLELLAPSRARAALHKALAANASARGGSSLSVGGAGVPAGSAAAEGAAGRTSFGRRGGASGAHPTSRRWQQQHRQAAAPCRRCGSLLGFLDHTSTVCGARLLRTNLLQPLTDVTTLELRLDSLQELLESPHLALELGGLMELLPSNLDKVCSNLSVRPGGGTKDASAVLGRLVSSVILLRDVLRCLPAIADSMAWVDSTLLKAIGSNLASEELRSLLAEVEAVLDGDAQASKTQFVNRVQQCYAVRAQVDSFLDISRATFSRLTESIHELAAQYRQSTGIPGLKVQYSTSRSFYLLVPDGSSHQGGGGGGIGGSTTAPHSQPASQAGGRHHTQQPASQAGRHHTSSSSLPKAFLVLEKRGRGATAVTTHELNALNSRLQDAASDCMALSVQVLQGLVGRLLARMPLLLRALDNIALLDMLLAFFQAVGGSDGDWCRPSFSPSGPLAITGGRHPLLQAARDAGGAGADGSGGQPCVPNDVYISPGTPLHVVAGPNMSGKSTYLKTAGLLVVLAQVGCFVPAGSMALAPYGSLHTRIGTADCIEANASSFMVEMGDMAGLLERAGPRSLVLIDELGRATSTSDGAALCWAMAEYLLTLGAHALLATHLAQLEGLAGSYPSVRLWRMQVDTQGGDLSFSWKIAPADDDATQQQQPEAPGAPAPAAAAERHYGILLGRKAGLPASVCDDALAIACQLEAKQQQEADALKEQQQGDEAEAEAAVEMRRLRQAHSLAHKLGCVAREAATQGLTLLDVEEGALDGGVSGGHQQAGEEADDARALDALLPVLQALQREAEQLLLAAARAPLASKAQA